MRATTRSRETKGTNNPPPPPPFPTYSYSSSLSSSETPEYDDTNHKSSHLFGLQALNNLDMAVNASYHHPAQQLLDSSGNSAEYSPPSPELSSYSAKRSLFENGSKGPQQHQVPQKPPRKATSKSPSRNMATNNTSSQMVSSMMEQLSQDPRFRSRLNKEPTDYDYDYDDEATSIVTSSFRASPSRQTVSPSRLSPSRTCMTDTEILRSPTEVLYAVSDKYGKQNGNFAHSASQTLHSELMQQRNPPPGRSSRTSSREDLLRPAYPPTVDEDKENSYKARIQVVSPDRLSPDRQYRTPYKTTINTATDNIIQYRGNPSSSSYASPKNGKLYQKNATYRRPGESEHYKVPKNKGPVEYLRGQARYGQAMATDSDHSSSVYYNGKNNLKSSRLVHSIDRNRHYKGELDREGRTIRRDRGRTYSGCSTSPDREISPGPGGYSRPKPPVRSYSNLHYRSPSTSPSRPPRAKSSPGRELLSTMMRKVSRTPSNRATATSRSPIKDIKRVQNEMRNGGRVRAQIVKAKPQYEADDSEDRLSRFTEYRGADELAKQPRVGAKPSRRTSMVISNDELEVDNSEVPLRERGRSLPPGAHIDSMRDFYKSAQYKSMYALPPSPTRPAPVLERAPSSSTLIRTNNRPVSRGTKVSISEGEVTDDQGIRRPKLVTNRFAPASGAGTPKPPARRPSTKRPAPSPPSNGRYPQPQQQQVIRRVSSSDRGLVRPPQRRPIAASSNHRRRATSMGDALDSSYSESEGLNGEPRPWSSVSEEDVEEDIDVTVEYEDELIGHPDEDLEFLGRLSTASSVFYRPPSTTASTTIVHVQPPRRQNVILYDKTPTTAFTFIKEKSGQRWTSHQSDIDSDYRRELATNGYHQEARGRDGGGIGATTDAKRRIQSSSPLGRSPSSAREEERRKVLEIEEERLRREREVQMRRGVHPGARVVRSNKPLDQDSQYSGHSSSSAMQFNRLDQPRVGRVVRRSASNVKKMPASVTSSLNSSEGEQQSNAAAAAAAAQRSVYLHAACVADIPPNGERKPGQAQQPPQSRGPPRSAPASSRALSADNRSTTTAPPNSSTSNLQKSKKISRSISLLAPFKSRPPAQNRYSEIHYDNSALYRSKPPRPPPVGPARRPPGTLPMQKDKRSASSNDLLNPEPAVAMSGAIPPPEVPRDQSARTLQRPIAPPPSASTSKVSRSVSMPKDSRLAGWFKKRKRI